MAPDRIEKTTVFDLEPQLRRLRRRLTAAMEIRGLSVRDMSVASDISCAAFSWYLSGTKVPNAMSLVRISRVLDVSIDFLLGSTKDPRVRRPSDAATSVNADDSSVADGTIDPR